jgi:hypothetical protein
VLSEVPPVEDLSAFDLPEDWQEQLTLAASEDASRRKAVSCRGKCGNTALSIDFSTFKA